MALSSYCFVNYSYPLICFDRISSLIWIIRFLNSSLIADIYMVRIECFVLFLFYFFSLFYISHFIIKESMPLVINIYVYGIHLAYNWKTYYFHFHSKNRGFSLLNWNHFFFHDVCTHLEREREAKKTLILNTREQITQFVYAVQLRFYTCVT